jgi:hypothetical protein
MTISQKLPSVFETKLTEYELYVSGLNQIGNADETAVFFSACCAAAL